MESRFYEDIKTAKGLLLELKGSDRIFINSSIVEDVAEGGSLVLTCLKSRLLCYAGDMMDRKEFMKTYRRNRMEFNNDLTYAKHCLAQLEKSQHLYLPEKMVQRTQRGMNPVYAYLLTCFEDRCQPNRKDLLGLLE